MRKLILLSFIPLLAGCSDPFRSVTSMDFSSAIGARFDDTAVITDKTTAVSERALLSSDQVLKSMSSVTGVPIANSVTEEYSRQQDVLGGTFEIETVTAPMLIGITNLAGTFCARLVADEIGRPADQKKFFADVNFSDPMSQTQFEAVVQKLALSFWGRSATAEELTALNTARTEFFAGSDSAKPVTSTIRSLMIMTCTGMLASFDSYTF